MKKYIATLSLAAMLALGSNQTNAQITFPQPSPTCNISQNFGTGKIEISYSRPGVKGRNIFGEIVPFNEVWRTGANSATTITFSDDVTINKTDVKAGKYGLLTIPGSEKWTVILTKDLNITSAQDYKQENDVVRVMVEPELLSQAVETFTIDINNFKSNEAVIEIKWRNTSVSFLVKTDVDTKLNKQIDDVMAKDTRPYHSAANFYLDNGKDLNKALEWATKATEINPNAYWSFYLKAKIQKALGDYKSAIATSNQSLEKAKTAGDNSYVKNNEKLIAELTAKAPVKGKKK